VVIARHCHIKHRHCCTIVRSACETSNVGGRRARAAELTFRTWGGARRNAGRRAARVALPTRRASRSGRTAHPRHPPDGDHVWNLRSERSYAVIHGALGRAREGRRADRPLQRPGQPRPPHRRGGRHARARERGARALHPTRARLNRMMGRSGAVFSDRYHAHVLRTPPRCAMRCGTSWELREPRGATREPVRDGGPIILVGRGEGAAGAQELLFRVPVTREPGTWLLHAANALVPLRAATLKAPRRPGSKRAPVPAWDPELVTTSDHRSLLSVGGQAARQPSSISSIDSYPCEHLPPRQAVLREVAAELRDREERVAGARLRRQLQQRDAIALHRREPLEHAHLTWREHVGRRRVRLSRTTCRSRRSRRRSRRTPRARSRGAVGLELPLLVRATVFRALKYSSITSGLGSYRRRPRPAQACRSAGS